MQTAFGLDSLFSSLFLLKIMFCKQHLSLIADSNGEKWADL